MKAWLDHHAHSFRIAIERMLDAPLASLLAILVMGGAILLPAALYLLLGNLKAITTDAAPRAEISVFFKLNVNPSRAQQISQDLLQRPEIASVRFIHRDDALKRLGKLGLGDVAAGLSGNPLPHALIVSLRKPDPQALDDLAKALRAETEIDQVKLDSEWARRLDAFLRLGERLIWLLAGLFGLGLAAITGNTIRLQIYAHRDEIEVARLLGATDRFIRRPFLYFGGLQGILGGLAAWGLLSLALFLLRGHIAELASAYGSQFGIVGLGWLDGLALLAISGLLGLMGAAFAVGHTQRSLHLS